MNNKIIIKNGNTPPSSQDLDVSELGFDKKNKKLYIGHDDGPILLNYGEDMSKYATKEQVTDMINEALGIIENGLY